MLATTTTVIVTYGDRASLCRASVEGALSAGASHCIIVDNGSPSNNAAALAAIERAFPGKVSIRRNPANEGSAGGFATGILAALKTGSDYIWLLDDDNVATPESLTELLRIAQNLSYGPPLAVMAYRDARGYQIRLANGASVHSTYPPASSFMYFDLSRKLRQLVGGTSRGRASSNPAAPPSVIEVPYGAYGGTLFPAKTMERIGLPDQRFRLYEDDSEYLHRVTEQGGAVLLALGARVHDIDTNWLSDTQRALGPARLLTAQSTAKVYLSVRNRVFFERHRLRHGSFRYAVNRLCYSLTLIALAARHRSFDRLALILRAVRDGERGRFDTCQPGIEL